MYAIVETGGKQYKVSVGETVEVERLDVEPGETVDLPRVLMVGDGDDVRVGRPILEDAKVSATVLKHGRGPKLTIFKYRAKQRYRRKGGHRQDYTCLRIDEIQA
ncbi:MAG: 50S ribosomal protein L21 [Chloroflexi bacterium RBG_13_56_8]|nr:MAG: 50S ribosomal protein L21 [Chloroflexi bacterium RBG_13_56_8]